MEPGLIGFIDISAEILWGVSTACRASPLRTLVEALGFRASGLEFEGIWALGFGAQDLRLRPRLLETKRT